MAQTGGGGGGAYPVSGNGNGTGSRSDPDEVRLLLQWAADQGGGFTSYPSELGAAVCAAQTVGLIVTDRPPIPMGENGSAGGGGFTSFSLTDKGRQELAARNARLGSAATRMAYGTQFIPGAGVVVYGVARRVSLSNQISFQDGMPIS